MRFLVKTKIFVGNLIVLPNWRKCYVEYPLLPRYFSVGLVDIAIIKSNVPLILEDSQCTTAQWTKVQRRIWSDYLLHLRFLVLLRMGMALALGTILFVLFLEPLCLPRQEPDIKKLLPSPSH